MKRQRRRKKTKRANVEVGPIERLSMVIVGLGLTGVFCFAFGLTQQKATISRLVQPAITEPRNLVSPSTTRVEPVSSRAMAEKTGYSFRPFGLCHTGGGLNCVVDGDTFWIDGMKVRVADIDAPETHPPRCPREAELGSRATARLRELLNAGPIELRGVDRDEDRYRRKLRVVMRDGRSLGDQLVSDGLARTWTGHRDPWC